VSFAAGAAIPILPFLVTTGTAAIVAVGVALLATGATVGVLTGGSLLRRACASSVSASPPPR
jgi:VIT1/CCC1 family predicted Fe2+/Mn2+ transporter